MKRTSLLFFFFFLFLFSSTEARAIPEDAILAVVNDDVITYRDLGEYLKSRYLQLKANGVPESEIKKIIAELETDGVQRLVEDRLIISEANKKEIKVKKESVDAKMSGIIKQYKSEDEFLTALATDGLTVSDLRKRIEDQLKVQHIIDKEIKSKIYINPQEVTEFYQQNLSKFVRPERISLDSIFIAKGSEPAHARKLIEEALQAIKSGQDFRKVAEKYSQAPPMGIVAKGQMLDQIEDAVWKLEAGKVSAIIEVENGFYIFQTLEKIPAQTAPLAEVKAGIEQMIFNQKLAQKLSEWVSELEKKAFVEIKQD